MDRIENRVRVEVDGEGSGKCNGVSQMRESIYQV